MSWLPCDCGNEGCKGFAWVPDTARAMQLYNERMDGMNAPDNSDLSGGETDCKNVNMNPANFPMLLNIIEMNFGSEAAKSFEHMTNELREYSEWGDTYDPWGGRVVGAWEAFHSAIINHK